MGFVLCKVYENWPKFKGNILTYDTHFEVSSNQSKTP